MKNLPENEWMKELEGRLRNYEEQPDETLWGAITQAVQPQREAAVWRWIDYAGSGAVILLAIFMLSIGGEKSELVLRDAKKAKNQLPTKNTTTASTQSQNALTANTIEAASGLLEKKNERTNSIQVRSQQIVFSDKKSVENCILNTSLAPPTSELNNSGTTRSEMQTIILDSLFNQKEYMRIDTLVLPAKGDEEKRTKEKKQRKAVTLYGHLTPSLSYYAMQPLANDEIAISSFNSPSVLSGDRSGFAGELGMQRKLSKKLMYTVGLTFYQQQQTIRYQTVSSSKNQIMNSASESFSYSIIPQYNQHIVSYNMTNVGVTAGFLYELKNAGLIHRIGLSGSYQQGFRKSNEESTYNNVTSSYAFYNVLYRIEYPINTKLKLYIQPTYSRGFYVNEKLKEPFSLKPARAGISVGIVVDF
jgi:hypothetical protein